MMKSLVVQIEERGSTESFIRLQGVLNGETQSSLETRLLEKLEENPTSRLILGGREWTGLDSTGAPVLVDFLKRFRLSGGDLCLGEISSPVQLSLVYLGLFNVLPNFSSFEEGAAFLETRREKLSLPLAGEKESPSLTDEKKDSRRLERAGEFFSQIGGKKKEETSSSPLREVDLDSLLSQVKPPLEYLERYLLEQLGQLPLYPEFNLQALIQWWQKNSENFEGLIDFLIRENVLKSEGAQTLNMMKKGYLQFDSMEPLFTTEGLIKLKEDLLYARQSGKN